MTSGPSRLRQLAIGLAVRRRLSRHRMVDPDEVWRHAMAHSPYYRRRAQEGPEERPVLEKRDLVDQFDELVTDRALTRCDLQERIAGRGDHRTDRYRVAMSSGTSGVPALMAFDADEWIDLIVNAARARAISGPLPGTRFRSAKVGSPSPWHLSTQLPATLHDPRRPSLVRPATDAVGDLVTALENWQPDVLSSYPSVLRQLVAEARAGRLHLSPGRVFSSGEYLSGATRAGVDEVWGVEVFDQYVATEVGFIAAECPAHRGLHVLDDHVLVEVVDDEGRPCPPGREGDVVLTALRSRTVPLIRYRIGDRATWADGPCGCGRTGPRLASIAGADRTSLEFPTGPDGERAVVHPVAITTIVDRLAVGSWVVRYRDDLLQLEVTAPSKGFDPEATRAQLVGVLHAAGARPAVRVVTVDAIEPTPGGKAARFRAVDEV